MTTTDTSDAQPSAPHQPMRKEHLAGILGTTRVESTRGGEHRPHHHLVRPHQQGGQARRPRAHASVPPTAVLAPDFALRASVRSTCWISPRKSANERLSSAERPTKTTSNPSRFAWRSCRYASRSRRLALLRSTAPPSRRPTAKPTLPSPEHGLQSAMKLSSCSRRPRCRKIASNSRARSRWLRPIERALLRARRPTPC
jgi:hypothetical protein